MKWMMTGIVSMVWKNIFTASNQAESTLEEVEVSLPKSTIKTYNKVQTTACSRTRAADQTLPKKEHGSEKYFLER